VAAPFPFDRTWALAAPRSAVWSLMERTDAYQSWWPWLRRFELDTLAPGAEGACVIRSPLGYALTFVLHIDRVEPAHAISARVHGDLDGPAALELVDAPGATTELRMHFALELRQSVLRPLAIVARPAMQWAHDRLSEAAVRDFRLALDQAPR